MDSRILTDSILSNFPYDPTPDQRRFIEQFGDFLYSGNQNEVMLVTGYAGTGKTTLVASLVQVLRALNKGFVLLAPTGRAAKVLSQYSGFPASTIHKKIYRQLLSPAGFADFVRDRNLHTDTVFIVDEASMIGETNRDVSLFGSGNLLSDLISYVYSGQNCRLVLMGDTAQLPPVGLSVSPALQPEALQRFGLSVRKVLLTEVLRQSSGSGILSFATSLRNMLENEDYRKPGMEPDRYSDIASLAPAEVPEYLEQEYRKQGMENVIVICRSNRQSNRYNAGIRRQILYREEELSSGDVMMVVKNDYFWLAEGEAMGFIANGDILRLKRIRRTDELYGFHFADASVVFPDYNDLEADVKLLFDTITAEAPSLPAEKQKELMQAILQEYDLSSGKKIQDYLRTNPWFNALQVKFAYAVTCHKAQGGQWQTVFVDPGRQDIYDREYIRWLYTAVTRGTDKVYLVSY
ncbi:MAG TPA: AAA family ATPase [Bacteroidales bacterium]|nr:AAA family ATPase [Bacteroidales bacterium]